MRLAARSSALILIFAGLAVLGAAGPAGPAGKAAFSLPLGVCDWTIGKAGDPAAFGLAARLGLDGVQVSLVSKGDSLALADPELRRAFIQAARKARIPIASFAIGELNDVPLKSDPRAEQWLGKGIEVAAAMEVRVILVPFFGQGELRDDPAGVDAVVAALKRLAPKAESRRVVLALESYLSAAEHLSILERVGSPAVKVYYDVGNSQDAGYPILDEIRQLGDRIVEVHAKDTKDLYGKGSMDFRAVLKALKDIGYKSWFVLEGTKMPLGIEESIRFDADFLRSIVLSGETSASDTKTGREPIVNVLSGKDMLPPKLIRAVAPKYPRQALAMGIEGTVVVEAVTDPSGQVARTKILKSIPALNRAATDAIRKWVYEPLIVDGRPRSIVFTVTLNFSGTSGQEPAEISPPTLLRQIKPTYPPEAVKAGLEGTVILSLTIGDNGLITDVKILESVPGLDQAAIDAVKEWQYSGAWIGGQPVHYSTTVTFQFSLGVPKKAPIDGCAPVNA